MKIVTTVILQADEGKILRNKINTLNIIPNKKKNSNTFIKKNRQKNKKKDALTKRLDFLLLVSTNGIFSVYD